MKEHYRNWAVLENNSVLEKLLFKLKHKLQWFLDNFCLLDCDSALEKLQQFIIDEVKHCAREEIKDSQT